MGHRDFFSNPLDYIYKLFYRERLDLVDTSADSSKPESSGSSPADIPSDSSGEKFDFDSIMDRVKQKNMLFSEGHIPDSRSDASSDVLRELFLDQDLPSSDHGSGIGFGASGVVKRHSIEVDDVIAGRVVKTKSMRIAVKNAKYQERKISEFLLDGKEYCQHIAYPVACKSSKVVTMYCPLGALSNSFIDYMVDRYNLVSNLSREDNIDWMISYNNLVFKSIKDIAAALKYIHNKKIVHADLKGENIFVTISKDKKELLFKLGDFGSALDKNDPNYKRIMKSELRGTDEYFSPEYLTDDIFDITGDVWALGILLSKMLNDNQSFLHKIGKCGFQIFFEGEALVRKMQDSKEEIEKVECWKKLFSDKDKIGSYLYISSTNHENLQRETLQAIMKSMLILGVEQRPSADELDCMLSKYQEIFSDDYSEVSCKDIFEQMFSESSLKRTNLTM